MLLSGSFSSALRKKGLALTEVSTVQSDKARSLKAGAGERGLADRSEVLVRGGLRVTAKGEPAKGYLPEQKCVYKRL